MSRKGILGPVAADAARAGQGGTAAPAETRIDPLRTRPLLGARDLAQGRATQPVGAISASLSALDERGKNAEKIEKQLAAGRSVIELDTAVIEPSFVTDRMPLTEEALSDLVQAIRENGQLSPILVRPHPEKPGVYQTAYGHRRIRASSILGIPVRAMVRELSDEEMVIAQGQENHARKDLSYIEKARFAERLDARFRRETIMQALSVYKSDLSNMLAVAKRIPHTISDSVGAAPKTGRRGWMELAELFKDAKLIEAAEAATSVPDFSELDSDERFKRVLAALKRAPLKSSTEAWADVDGRKLGKLVANDERITLTVDRNKSPDFAEFILVELRGLYAEREKGRAGGKTT